MRIQAKILSIAMIILIAGIAAEVVTSSYIFTREYSQALKYTAISSGENLVAQVDRIVGLGIPLNELVGFDKQCQELVERNRGIDYAMVLDLNGNVLFHSNPARCPSEVNSAIEKAYIKDPKKVGPYSVETERHYQAVLPILNRQNDKIAAIVVGTSADVIDEKISHLVESSTIVSLFTFAIAAALLFLALRFWVTRPLSELFESINRLRKNKRCMYGKIRADSRDEIGSVCSAFNSLIEDLNTSHEIISIHAEKLEAMVNDRTTELRKLNEQLECDIAERKKIEETLRASECSFRTIVENVNDSIYIHDFQGNILDVNENACRTLGYQRHELIGANLAKIDSPKNTHNILQRMEQLLRDNSILFEGENVHKNGSLVPVEVSAKVVNREGAGVVQGFVRNITERKRAEEEKERLQTRLAQAQKMEYIGRLAGGIAHDFNNMLGIIVGNAEMATLAIEPDEPVYAHFQEILMASQRSADLVRQLLAFARKQTVRPKVLDLNDSVDVMLKMLRRVIGEDIELHWVPGSDLWPVRIDPSQIDQILVNLAVNARDAIAGVGKVTIETDNATIDEACCVDHPGFVPGQFVLLAFSDNGMGMSREVLDRLFEPFFTTKELGKGTGLGLATIYGIVKQNEGFIYVYSEPGKGTTFKVYLPRVTTEAVESEADGEPETLQRGTETVLMVEDEEAILTIGQAMLELLGYTVLTANSPREAIRLAQEYSGAIHLLFTDVVMPEMTGRKLAEQLGVVHPGLKYLYMSGYTANIIVHHGVLEKGVLFIHKPFLIKELAQKVREALDKV